MPDDVLLPSTAPAPRHVEGSVEGAVEGPVEGTARRVGALVVLVAAVVVGAWQAGRIVGPLDTGAPLPAHVSVHGSVVTR
ncbi:hypothetical protein ACQEVB_28095 [Pseudonocardia sp. CA-107938]|uniref:hypothetical protein n=1 Tax=Pseudonocardia sp. CA-107938 TaxID=3240021 RepID=UPI003D933DB7